MNETIRWYDKNAEQYADKTKGIDASELYRPFLSYLKAGSLILDAGCGSGRDANHFARLGFSVIGIDASSEMVSIARRNTGLDIQQMRFEEMEFEKKFDGVWALASLLHVPKFQMKDVITRLGRSLIPNGVMSVSLKYGTGEAKLDGRMFNFYDEETFRLLINDQCDFEIEKIWLTNDLREGRKNEKWLNAVLKKQK